MDFSVTHEAYVFLISVLSGAGMGLIYDLLRCVRRCAKSTDVITDIEDIIFWAISIAVMFFSIFFTNHGVVRWYQFFGVILGSILYFLTLSRVICICVQKIIEIFLKIFIFFCKILLTPLLFTFNILYRSILFIFVPIFRLFVKWKGQIFRRLKSGAKRTKAALMKK